jgi:enoyl-CoA hydratase/carnithine racemase
MLRDAGEIVMTAAPWTATHFKLKLTDGVAHITLNRPERKNPLTFESYAELRDLFRRMADEPDAVHAVVISGAGGNFCSGGDVFEIIEPLTKMDMKGLLAFTRMTGDLVKAIQACPQPVIAAVEGVCVGAGAIIAMASDLRYATPDAKAAFLFTRVGLAGCDMGACAILPRIIGQGRAADLLYSGRSFGADEGVANGFWNRLAPDGDSVRALALETARSLAAGPRFAHMMTKTMLRQEWAMGLEAAIEAEAQAQAICMQTEDFRIAFEAFAGKTRPVFVGR